MKTLNLYHVSQNVNTGYDTHSDFVVAAPDVKTARNTSPSGVGSIDWKNSSCSWCSKPSQVKVKLIGVAAEGVEPGVICSSFHAG